MYIEGTIGMRFQKCQGQVVIYIILNQGKGVRSLGLQRERDQFTGR